MSGHRMAGAKPIEEVVEGEVVACEGCGFEGRYSRTQDGTITHCSCGGHMLCWECPDCTDVPNCFEIDR